MVLSFSDSDLGAFAAGWRRAAGGLPSLRLCNLVALRHPVSVDTYLENTLADARGILIRLIGGEAYWPYGLASVQDLARRRGIALAVLPADGRDDPRLDAVSTVPGSVLRQLKRLCDAGGAVAAQAALAQLALAAGLYAGPVPGQKTVPERGFYDPDTGVIAAAPPGPLVLVSFYRSYLSAADTGPVDALIREFRQAGFASCGMFAPSLKAPGLGDWLRDGLGHSPAAIVNATGFSVRAETGTSPFDGVDCPVFQVALSTNRRREWASAERGLSPADLAMHVVLPEIDGRVFAGVVSFKAAQRRDPDLQYSRFAHRADPDRIAATVRRVAAWHRLATADPPRGKWRWCCRPIPVATGRWPMRSGWMRWHRAMRQPRCWRAMDTPSRTARRRRPAHPATGMAGGGLPGRAADPAAASARRSGGCLGRSGHRSGGRGRRVPFCRHPAR